MKLKKPNFLKSPLEHYRDSVELFMQDKAEVFRDKSVKKKLPFVYTLVFAKKNNRPLTSFSYGVSFANHPDQFNNIELCLQMNSEDLAWAHIVGYLSNQLRGDCPFHTGEIIRLGQKISNESELNAFIVAQAEIPGVINPIKDSRKNTTGIHLVELIPIYEREIVIIQKIGLTGFMDKIKHEKLNPHRKAIE